MRFTIISCDGIVEFDSEKPNKEELENHINREEVKMAINEGEGFHIRKSKTLDKYYAYYAVAVENENSESYIIRTSQNYASKMKQIRYFTLGLITFFILLNLIINFFYNNYLKRDLENKIKIMKNFLEKDSDEKLLYSSREEKWLFEFWEVLKKWQENNLDNIKKLDTEKSTMSLIISSVDAFVGLIDEEGRYILKNDSLHHLMIGDMEKFNESFKYIEIITSIKEGMKLKKEIREEIYISAIKENFLLNIKYIEKRNHYLITLKDITSTKQAIEVQKTFINNVSHELKTPLTNIKGYLIALEDAPKEIRMKFLSIINNNVTKLENTIIDFLNISKIENSKILQITQVEVEDLKKDLLQELENLLKTKKANLNLTANLLKNKTSINIDKEKLMLVLKNLGENALIYNNSESPYVKINIVEEVDRYIFYVRDNGLGIPSDKRRKIFERFYRIDKARTSNKGGTGLGLSIVKEVVEQFRGEIKIGSSEGEGSMFIFYLMK